jgi:hypothetical protein
MDDDNRGNVAEPVLAAVDEASAETWPPADTPGEVSADPEVVEAAVVQEIEETPIVDGEPLLQEQAADGKAPRRRGGRRKVQEPGAQRTRKTASKPRTQRSPRAH